jgi:hypothetical protein
MTGYMGVQSSVFLHPPAASSTSSGTLESGPSRAEGSGKSTVIRYLITAFRYIYGTAAIIPSPDAPSTYRPYHKSNNPL